MDSCLQFTESEDERHRRNQDLPKLDIHGSSSSRSTRSSSTDLHPLTPPSPHHSSGPFDTQYAVPKNPSLEIPTTADISSPPIFPSSHHPPTPVSPFDDRFPAGIPAQPPTSKPCGGLSMTDPSAPPPVETSTSADIPPFLPSPLHPQFSSPTQGSIFYTHGPPGALMASSGHTGLGTPPISTRNSSVEIDQNPTSPSHSYPQPPNGYFSQPNSGGQYAYGQVRDGPLEPSPVMYTTPPLPTLLASRRSPGRSPTIPRRKSHHIHWNPYGYEERHSPPLPHRSASIPGLPWPSSVPRPEAPFPPTSGSHPQEMTLPSYHEQFSESTYPPRYDHPWHDQGRGYSREEGPIYKCPRCRFTATTQEQLTKHQQKHLKVHHCRFPQCSRTEGFATPNDRERHEKSIHKIPGQYWKCLDPSCSSYKKEFSRRDNLKDHLRRMHPIQEGIGENEASALRSRLADMWRFEKVTEVQPPEPR